MDHGDEIDAEVTVKLHLVGEADAGTRAGWVEEALEFLGETKGLRSVDNLLLGFSGVDYKGRKTIASEMFGCGAEGLESGSGSEVVDADTERGVKEVWNLVSAMDLGVERLGTLYLPLESLRGLSEERVCPRINAMDTPDCQTLPKEYAAFARERGIELWAGGGGEGAGQSIFRNNHDAWWVRELIGTQIRYPWPICITSSKNSPSTSPTQRDNPTSRTITYSRDSYPFERTD